MPIILEEILLLDCALCNVLLINLQAGLPTRALQRWKKTEVR